MDEIIENTLKEGNTYRGWKTKQWKYEILSSLSLLIYLHLSLRGEKNFKQACIGSRKLTP